MTAQEEWRAIGALMKLKARYFRAVDTHDWSSFAEVFTPDAVLDVINAAGDRRFHVTGATEIVQFVRERIGQSRSVHHGHMPEIDVRSGHEAFGIWAMEDRLSWADRSFHGWGHYHEHYRCDGEHGASHIVSCDASPCMDRREHLKVRLHGLIKKSSHE